MNSQSPAREPRPITGRFVLVSLILFFLVIFGVNGTMMALAIKTMPGVDVRNSYEASQRFNRDIAAAREQAARGWAADASLRLKGAVAAITLDMRDDKGMAIGGLDVSARLIHPATHAEDHVAKMASAGAGRYVAELADVQRGAWDLVIEASREGARVFTSRSRVFLTE